MTSFEQIKIEFSYWIKNKQNKFYSNKKSIISHDYKSYIINYEII